VALFPVGTIDVCYANTFMFKCIFEVVDNNRSEGILSQLVIDLAISLRKSTYARVVLPAPARNQVSTS
jgi:hypothetical protein